MKSIHQTLAHTLAISGANLLALTLSAGDATALEPRYSDSAGPRSGERMAESQLRAAEAAHLEVYAGCKWGRAAFDPVKVGREGLPPEVRSVHDQMARA